MRHVCAVTGARSDFGYLLPVLQRIGTEPSLRLSVIATGMHLNERFGLTVKEVESSVGHVEYVRTGACDDTALGIATSMGAIVSGLAEAYDRLHPDVLLLLGDRTETFAAAVAIVPFATPIAHIAGGESTLGAIDDAIRHAITKLSHLHFVATERYRDRLLQMGEEAHRVIVSGSPTLDNVHQVPLLDPAALAESIGMPMTPPPLLVTFHPVTLEPEDTGTQMASLLEALAILRRPVVFTYPNADVGSGRIIAAIDEYVRTHSDSRFVTSLGTQRYFSLMRHAAAMVGNSSSGIIEAASFELPVVNVGRRQEGRDHAGNVVDVECSTDAIVGAVRRVTSNEFRRSLAGMVNPYGDGHAAERIVERLRSVPLGSDFLMKRFVDIPYVPREASA